MRGPDDEDEDGSDGRPVTPPRARRDDEVVISPGSDGKEVKSDEEEVEAAQLEAEAAMRTVVELEERVRDMEERRVAAEEDLAQVGPRTAAARKAERTSLRHGRSLASLWPTRSSCRASTSALA